MLGVCGGVVGGLDKQLISKKPARLSSHWPAGQSHFSALSAEDICHGALQIRERRDAGWVWVRVERARRNLSHNRAEMCARVRVHSQTGAHHLGRHRCLLPDQGQSAVKFL